MEKLKTKDRFDYIKEVAVNIPFISITRMIGLPEKYWEVAMANTRRVPMKDRTRIGEVKFLMEEMAEARAASSSCVHVEAALEPEVT